ncbi:MAG: hypothetical protein IT298_06420 [Chloroflexi bacterium]|nr:MAG: hypothetical protein UZ13_01387 [Chloroflexi bacterium OLB13]MBC6955877.1 hypothetical protein [Chloroflexota bacterium]MBV6436580.1 hypothetical protein [Anaerolineae bacterium]MDL1915443.1 hypothetical protein [Anaerolineae bacterium CFX4]OQY81606.1 MAG: hypothetical protein B6D42_10915 [Anaerolineae bacterium UTCFX5]
MLRDERGAKGGAMLAIRKPVVRADAARYVLILTLAFALCVVVTRVYLELAGYPQLGNDTYHFAHALWGGLLQFFAVLLPLLCVNRWARDVSAVLAGAGAGLFIDEVGKFITQQNDYFFPLAAPIIYVAFLTILLIYLIVRRRQSSTDVHAEMYYVLGELEEVLEDDLSVSERDHLVTRLQQIAAQTARPDVADLARHITQYLQSASLDLSPDRITLSARCVALITRFEKRFLPRPIARALLIALFALSGVLSLVMLYVLATVLGGARGSLPDVLRVIVSETANVDSARSLNWYLILIGLDLVTGMLLLVAMVAFLIRRDVLASALGMIALVVTLAFSNTLSFYFDQFSVLFNTMFTFGVLLMLQRYRDRFVGEPLLSDAESVVAPDD